MLREPLRDYLQGDATLLGLLTGGVYPDPTTQQSVLSAEGMPGAFDNFGDVLPVALVLDDSVIPDVGRGAQVLGRVLVWQQRGRDKIDAVNLRVYALLHNYRLVTAMGIIYQVRFAGFGPQVRDQGLRDAEHGWSRWQAVRQLA